MALRSKRKARPWRPGFPIRSAISGLELEVDLQARDVVLNVPAWGDVDILNQGERRIRCAERGATVEIDEKVLGSDRDPAGDCPLKATTNRPPCSIEAIFTEGIVGDGWVGQPPGAADMAICEATCGIGQKRWAHEDAQAASNCTKPFHARVILLFSWIGGRDGNAAGKEGRPRFTC